MSDTTCPRCALTREEQVATYARRFDAALDAHQYELEQRMHELEASWRKLRELSERRDKRLRRVMLHGTAVVWGFALLDVVVHVYRWFFKEAA